MINNIKRGSHSLISFFDPGSNLTMITHDAAKKLGRRGLDVCMTMAKVGNQTEIIESKQYKVPLIDEDDNEWVNCRCGEF